MTDETFALWTGRVTMAIVFLQFIAMIVYAAVRNLPLGS
jgi:hypothetical protein